MISTPYRTPSTKQRGCGGLQSILLAPVKSSRKLKVEDDSADSIAQYFSSCSNPTFVEENAQLKEMTRQLKEENIKLKSAEAIYKSQIASLQKQVTELEVFRNLLLTRRIDLESGEVQQEKQTVKSSESNLELDSLCTPTKTRILAESQISLSYNDVQRNTHLSYDRPKHVLHPYPVAFVEDSLLGNETPSTSVIQKRDFGSVNRELPSFTTKRQRLVSSILEENSETNISLNLSALNYSGARHSIPGARELSFRSCSSIESDGGSSSLLRDINPAVNFHSICLSDIDSDSVAGHEHGHDEAVVVAVDVEMNVDEMSYSALLQLEHNQKGVLDDRWKERRSEVMSKMEVRKWRRDDASQQRESNEACCICTCEYEEGDSVMVFPCRDLFHQDCVEGWLQAKWTCPFCKLDLMNSCLSLYVYC